MTRNITFRILSLALFISLLALNACNSDKSKNKEVELNSVISEMQNDLNTADTQHNHQHSHDSGKAIVNEVLHTERYSYLNVSDQNGHSFWIAIQRDDVNKGDMVTYEGGLLKQNFESKEFNRVFETIYLVSRYKLIKEGETNSTSSSPGNETENKSVSNTNADVKFSTNPSLADLVANPVVFSEKEVSISGKVTKVNFNIMGINWVHLNNENSPGVDFTLTTHDQVAVGQNISFKGKISVDKDFGAGYRYAVIMEKASLVK